MREVVARENEVRGGIDLELGDLTNGVTHISPVWLMGGWKIRFVRLAPGAVQDTDQSDGDVYLKVIAGRVEGRAYGAYPPVGTVATARWDEEKVCATHEGALLCLLTQTAEVRDNVVEMNELRLTGPLEQCLGWQSFEEKFSGVTDVFDGLAAYMVPGFHLLDGKGQEYAYVHFWTAGKDVDVSTHNHAHDPSPNSPAFAEVHLALNNGTGLGGMYQCDAPGALERTQCLLQRGEEHGPFFHFDAQTGRPQLLDNGAVSYPWHGWKAGTDTEPGQCFDLVAAFEIITKYAVV